MLLIGHLKDFQVAARVIDLVFAVIGGHGCPHMSFARIIAPILAAMMALTILRRIAPMLRNPNIRGRFHELLAESLSEVDDIDRHDLLECRLG